MNQRSHTQIPNLGDIKVSVLIKTKIIPLHSSQRFPNKTVTMSSSSSTTTFVVGATGATGKYVVQYLLDQGQNVKVVCRSVEKMKSLLTTSSYGERLQITEASISQVSDQDLEKLTQDCTHVVSCLGHNMTLAGMFGREDRRLVTDAVTRLTKVMPPSAKFILMGTAGVTVPTDEPRSMVDRTILFFCRTLLPPHCDNEETAAHFLKLQSPEWCMVRPTNLRDGEPQKHVLYSTPPGGLFAADAIVTRSTVAKFMVNLILDSSLFQTFKYQSPLIYDDPSVLTTESAKTK